ncbi:hypothetical protein KAJ87_04020 [Candidatus Pacearchaeota archaeon]|nr:hypothetical protein [Candidatus Pacearchaeota archaeon]
MGVIRSILLVFVSVLFFVSLLAGGLFLTLSLSLDYDNVKTGISSTVQELDINGMTISKIMEDAYPLMEIYCMQNNSEFVFKDPSSGHTFSIPCEILPQGPQAIVNYGINDFVEQVYYKEYDCNFWDCLEKTGSPLFLISAKAKGYWHSKFYFLLLLSVILIGVSFLLVEKKSNSFIITGALIVASSLPFMKLESIISLFSDNYLSGILIVFFSEASNVFWIMLVSGIVFLVAGILLKLFGIGFKISGIFSKINEKISKNKMTASPKEVGKEISKNLKDKKSK